MDSWTCLPRVQSHYSLYSFWTRLKWFKITRFWFCLISSKRQSWKTKLEDWHEPSNKSEITGFYLEKIANLLWVSTSFLSPYFCNGPFCGRRCYETSICISYCRSRWLNNTNPTKLSAFISPPSTSCTGEQSIKLLLNR